MGDIRTIEQATASQELAMSLAIKRRLLNLHTAMPGIVDSYDAAKQTVSVQPALQRVLADGTVQPLPLCVDVPVVFPGCGDFWLTFPINPGDECLIVFAERSIDFWYQEGGVQSPSEFRMHDLSDAFAIVGINSQPNKLSDVQTDGAELRTRSRSKYFKLTEDGFEVKGDVVIDGNVTATEVRGTTEVYAKQGGLQVGLSSHLAHLGNMPPTPGT